MDEQLFEKIAEQELQGLARAFDAFDPDEVESDFGMGVLSLTLADGGKVVVNSHRAAGQIWMAAFRTAWHFTPRKDGDTWSWRTEKDELHAALSRLLSEHLGRTVAV